MTGPAKSGGLSIFDRPMPDLDLTLQEAARIIRESMKDKSYRQYPIGLEAGAYLRARRKRFTSRSYQDVESCLDKLSRYFCDLELRDLEPPVGTERIEEFLEHQWGHREARTYNKNLSNLRAFFKWQVIRGNLHGDPTLPIERAKTRGVHRTTFSEDQRRAIIVAQDELRDRLAVRLLLYFGLRKGALLKVQFKHFDHARRRLTIFTKGGKVQTLTLDHGGFWLELERLILDTQANPSDYLLCHRKLHPVSFEKGTRRALEYRVTYRPDRPMGEHGAHNWWYRCLERAGVVQHGTTSGERMHKARHTAGQFVLDRTGGNVKAAQKLLGHASMQTTADVYLDWDIDRLSTTMGEVLEDLE
jgi:integrase